VYQASLASPHARLRNSLTAVVLPNPDGASTTATAWLDSPAMRFISLSGKKQVSSLLAELAVVVN
jgi:hypothetical protein